VEAPNRHELLRRRRLVALSFPLAFAAHDLEEVLAAGHWERHGAAIIRARFPRVPERVLEVGVPRAPQLLVAIGVVSAGVIAVSVAALAELRAGLRGQDEVEAAATIDGRRLEPGVATALLQAALAGFTVHGITHVGSAVALRAYVPGVATTPLVIAPYSLWAWRTLRATGLPWSTGALIRSSAVGSGLAVGAVLTGHLVGRRLRPAAS
jgi:hypothetical protein